MLHSWLDAWTNAASLFERPTIPRLLLAMILGTIVGAERQWRQRAAGLRTNTLVCLGAAAFVDLGATLAGPNSTGVIAYVISGVGFLGAGAIIKDRANITGLNTAATLWCSAAVGACAGAGEMLDAIFVTMLLVCTNLALRPVSSFIDRHSTARFENVVYRIKVVCDSGHQLEVRTLLLHAIAEQRLLLRHLRTENLDDDDEVQISAEVEAERRNDALIDGIADALRANPAVTAVERAEGAAESE
jgi:putative Mg2+ transporter-C (MgtC) family protein